MSDAALAIANIKALYCATADLGAEHPEAARAQFGTIFSDDFFGDFGMATFDRGEAMTDFLCTVINANAEWMVHMLGSPRITINGDTAKGDWTVLVWSKRREGGEPMRVIGRYSDEFRRTADGWKISRIAFRQYQ
jgi:SnoaL-like domain